MKSNEKQLKLAAQIEGRVRALTDLGERSVRRPDALEAAAALIEKEFQKCGYQTYRQTYQAGGVACSNIEAFLPGFRADRPHLLVGAHYDSAEGTPGADDNASAVALLLELAGQVYGRPELPLRFVAFVNEEPPFFQTPLMGSMQFAARSVERGENIAGMVCLESLGVFINEPLTQIFPDSLPERFHIMPKTLDLTKGNFVAVIGNDLSSNLMLSLASNMKGNSRGLPVAFAAMPELEVSDHLAFWKHGFPAVMVTDTAMLRNLHYHQPTDTPEKLNYLVMTQVLRALEAAVSRYADSILKGKHIPRIPDAEASRKIVQTYLGKDSLSSDDLSVIIEELVFLPREEALAFYEKLEAKLFKRPSQPPGKRFLP
ncbi:MAG: M28 family peptidase [Terrimicrobiaceae bacterium]